MPNPNIPLGQLNRLKGSLTVMGNSNLTVTASYLGEAGITATLDGEAVTYIKVMSGAVASPEPYMMVTLSLNLVKTTSLATAYKTQLETNAVIGDTIFTPDSTSLPTFYFTQCSISGVREMNTTGKDAGFMVVLTGYYNINSNLWNL
jgi:hypothetical protein